MMGCNSSMDTNSVLDEPLGGAVGGLAAGQGMPNSQWPLSQAVIKITLIIFPFFVFFFFCLTKSEK